jgi:ribosome maturation factor RimP
VKEFRKYIGQTVELKISGELRHSGLLMDTGTDIIVIYNGRDFFYLPLFHIQSIRFDTGEDLDYETPNEVPIDNQDDPISLRKILYNAKGLFSEIFVTNQSIHGYVTSVMNDYFLFYSPVYKTIYVPLQHLKWLTPYNQDQSPYALNNEDLPLKPNHIPLARSFEEQLKKSTGKMVVFDLGSRQNKIGKLVKVINNQIELIVARNETVYLNLYHIKTVHFP